MLAKTGSGQPKLPGTRTSGPTTPGVESAGRGGRCGGTGGRNLQTEESENDKGYKVIVFVVVFMVSIHELSLGSRAQRLRDNLQWRRVCCGPPQRTEAVGRSRRQRRQLYHAVQGNNAGVFLGAI